MMKRITQMLASILFILTVLTVYLAFDFAINNAMSNKHSSDTYNHHHDDIKLGKLPSDFIVSSSSQIKQTNQTINHNHAHRTRNLKQKQVPVKPAQFHKSKTGVKINQIRKSIKERRKHLSTTTTKFVPYKKTNLV